MRLLYIILLCLVLAACSGPDQGLQPSETPVVLPPVMPAESVHENVTLNVTENATGNPENLTPQKNILEEEPALINGAVDVTVRIGAFKTRKIFQEGEGLQVGNRTFLVVFIGDTPGGPEAFLSVDDESASLGRHDEEYMHDAWLYVHEVYFRDRQG